MRIAFAIEDQLGHRALLANLRAAIAEESGLEPIWFPVDPGSSGVLSLPYLRNKHALIFGLKLRKVIRDAESHGALDACFIHTREWHICRLIRCGGSRPFCQSTQRRESWTASMARSVVACWSPTACCGRFATPFTVAPMARHME